MYLRPPPRQATTDRQTDRQIRLCHSSYEPVDKSTSGTLRRILRDSYVEEFKYYFCFSV